jgi:hypothetical protein
VTRRDGPVSTARPRVNLARFAQTYVLIAAYLKPPRRTFQTFFALSPSILSFAASGRFLVMILSHRTTELWVCDHDEKDPSQRQIRSHRPIDSVGPNSPLPPCCSSQRLRSRTAAWCSSLQIMASSRTERRASSRRTRDSIASLILERYGTSQGHHARVSWCDNEQIGPPVAYTWKDLRPILPSGTVGKTYQDETLMTARRVRQTDRAHDEVFCQRCQAENMVSGATGTRTSWHRRGQMDARFRILFRN